MGGFLHQSIWAFFMFRETADTGAVNLPSYTEGRGLTVFPMPRQHLLFSNFLFLIHLIGKPIFNFHFLLKYS